MAREKTQPEPEFEVEAAQPRAVHAAKLVKRAKKPDHLDDVDLAGTYRVVHGSVEVTREVSLWQNEDGSRKIGEPPFESATVGDEIALCHEDAKRLLDQGVVERLDTRPSKVGKVVVPIPLDEMKTIHRRRHEADTAKLAEARKTG